ncbi:hypothetical protein Tco_0721016 [Tanacetum coccineum]
MIPSIPIGGSISPKGFLLLVLLLVVIIVTVVVIVILIVVVVDDVSLILKLSFEIIGISLGLVFLLGLLALAIAVVCVSKMWLCPLVMIALDGLAKVMAVVSDVMSFLGGASIQHKITRSEITDGIILESSEELKEMLPDEAGK